MGLDEATRMDARIRLKIVTDEIRLGAILLKAGVTNDDLLRVADQLEGRYGSSDRKSLDEAAGWVGLDGFPWTGTWLVDDTPPD